MDPSSWIKQNLNRTSKVEHEYRIESEDIDIYIDIDITIDIYVRSYSRNSCMLSLIQYIRPFIK